MKLIGHFTEKAISPYEQIKPFSNEPDVYISFTTVDKIGINPQTSQYRMTKEATPAGLYAYPIIQVWKEYRIDQEQRFDHLPYAGKFPYIWVIQEDVSANSIYDLDTDYTARDFVQDFETLEDHIIQHPDVLEKIRQNFPKESQGDNFLSDILYKFSTMDGSNHPARHLLNMTQWVSGFFPGKPLVQWNVLLRKVLGYDVLSDRSGKGLISPVEPIQTLFLHRGAFEVLTMVHNRK